VKVPGERKALDMARAARRLVRTARSATLATTMRPDGGGPAGAPYASLVTVACDWAGQPIMLLSHLAEHTRNLIEDPRAALLVEAASRRHNPQTGPRVTLTGAVSTTTGPALAARFLARHPEAKAYAGFADFGFFRMTVERAHYVGGFARARWMNSDLVLSDARAAATISAAEEAILEEVNRDRGEAIDRCARRLLGRRGAGWTMTGIDPDGCDLVRNGRFARLDFDDPANDGAQARAALDRILTGI
jgi:putative heme iron utilization protein